MLDFLSVNPLKQDFHMHTTFCDGKDSPEDMILSAIEKGLERVGVSIHSVLPDYYFTSEERELAFKKNMAELKEKYKDKIKVYCGLEADYRTEPITRDGFDYVIGAVHILVAKGKRFYVDSTRQRFLDGVNQGFDGDCYSYIEEYYRCVADVVEKTKCDFIAHIDLVSKFNKDKDLFDENHPRYVKAYQTAVDKLIKYNIPFEINVGAISRGYMVEPYPLPPVLEYIKKKGGKLIMSSDSHAKENVAYQYDIWKKLL